MSLYAFDEMASYLDDIYDALPEEIISGLTGGVLFLEETKRHPEEPELIILGEYIVDPLGRRINLYYGSFLEKFSFASPEEMQEELKKTLYHELTHHIEMLAGERDLEIEDAIFMEKFKKGELDE